jgi:regulator of protease activity HflC (stomatin/prohibitin superfamily)
MLQIWVRVPEMEVWTKYNRETKAFVGYLPPARHWIWPWERIGGKISTQVKAVGGKCLNTQTEGGITSNVNWSATYRIEPSQIASNLWSAMARTLPEYSEKMVRSHGNNCIARVISELPVSDLTNNGNRSRLEREIRERLANRLRPFGIQVFRVMVTGVELPPKVEATYQAAHERIVHAYSEAEALERLHQAISKFSDSDMERLVVLKQVHALGQNGVAMYMPPIVTSFQSGSRPNGEARDGRKPNGPSPSTSAGADGGHGEWPSITH